MKKASSVAIIGAGIAGIAAALRLRKHGFEVTVFEANAYAGGKMSELNANGFRFDKGPTVLTKPEYVEDLFKLFGKTPSDYWQSHPVEPIFKYFFEDGTVINSSRNQERFSEEIASKTSTSATSILKFLKDVEKTHQLTDEVFLQRSLHKFKNYLDWPTARGILNFGKVDVFRSMNKANEQRFSDQKVIDIFNRYASYNGSNPYLAPATLNVIAHYEITLGTYFSEGGIYSIIDALTDLARVGTHQLLHSNSRNRALETEQRDYERRMERAFRYHCQQRGCVQHLQTAAARFQSTQTLFRATSFKFSNRFLLGDESPISRIGAAQHVPF